MIDENFFSCKGPHALATIVQCVEGELVHGDPDAVIKGIGTLEKADSNCIASFHNAAYRKQLSETKAGVVLLSLECQNLPPKGTARILVKDPHQAWFKVLKLFYAEQKKASGVHAGANVHPTATLGEGSTISIGAVLEEGVVLGKGCFIGPYTVVGRKVRMGDQCRIEAHVTISHTYLGKNVYIKPGARIGQGGFGFLLDRENPALRESKPQLGCVHIGDNVEIGANTTVDRGSTANTVIGDHVRIDNLVQIAHNVRIGAGSVVVAQAGIAGSTVLEENVVLGGQAGISGHLLLKKGTSVAAQSGVMRNTVAGATLMGSPATDHRVFFKQYARFLRNGKDEKE